MDSKELFSRSSAIFPKGVNSPVRYFDPYPFFTDHAHGSRLYTADKREIIDYCMAYGVLLFGHSPQFIVDALKDQLSKGTVYGTPSALEIMLGEEVKKAFPSIEKLRFVNSGGEATTNAIRLARACTKREVVVKFDGCYHGAVDSLMVNGVGTSQAPFSDGVPKVVAEKTKVIPFNDFHALDKIGEETACVIVEPVMGNIGLVQPLSGFLDEIRRRCDETGALLIFDEVITGFRIAKGGAQEYYNVHADLTTLGKVLGGGLPMGAFGGREDIMHLVAPEGRMYNAGTFNGNPLSMAAGIASLRKLDESLYRQLRQNTSSLCSAISDILSDEKIDFYLSILASIFTVFFTSEKVIDYASAKKSKLETFKKFHRSLLDNGVYIPPSQFECSFLSTAHSKEDIEKTIETMKISIKSVNQTQVKP